MLKSEAVCVRACVCVETHIMHMHNSDQTPCHVQEELLVPPFGFNRLASSRDYKTSFLVSNGEIYIYGGKQACGAQFGCGTRKWFYKIPVAH